jgi:hypothetical protein
MTHSAWRCIRAPRVRLALWVAALALAAGCSTQPLRLSDSSAPSLVVGGVLRAGESRSDGVEVQLVRVRGQGHQPLTGNGLPLQLDSTSFTSPATLRHDATLTRVQVGWNKRLFADRPVEMEVSAGAHGTRLAWSSSVIAGAPASASVLKTRLGLSGGVLGRYKFNDQWAMQVRAQGLLGRATGSRLEAAAVWRPVPALQVRVGYARDELRMYLNDRQSDLGFRTQGPFAGVQFEF